MRIPASILALALILGVALSCKLGERLAGDKNAGTVSTLWSDVPPFEGATKADLEIPLGARLFIRGMMQGKVNFISFKTNKTAQEVKDFYTKERMKAAGWNADERGCVGDTDEEKNNHGAICLYQRKDGGKDEGLAIIVAQDEKLPETNIFYARIDMTK